MGATLLVRLRVARSAGGREKNSGVSRSVGSVEKLRCEQAHPGVAVDERVVDLEVDGDAPLLEALDEVRLPRRPVEIERRSVQARHEDAELALVAR